MQPAYSRSLNATVFTIIFAFASLCPSVSCKAAQPGETVGQFYAKYLEVHKSGGLPTEPELTALRPFLSKRLRVVLDDALKYQADWAKRHPKEAGVRGGPPVIYKPPFVDGEYFASNFEGFKRFSVGDTKALSGDRWRITVHFWYEPASKGWQDSAVVIRENGRYVIDDVVFSGHGSFNPAGHLSEVLRRREKE